MDKMPHLIENGYYAPYCLSALNLPDDLESRWNEISQAELFKYMNKRKDEGTYKDEANLIWDFIVERNVKYIVVEHGCELPQYLVGKVSIVYDGCDKVYRNGVK